MYKRKVRDIKNFPNEEWRNIKGYEGLYQVSNLGRIKSLAKIVEIPPNKQRSFVVIRHESEFIRKPTSDGNYLGFNTNDGKRMYVHRAVASAFIPNPDNKPEVNHINGNKEDNRAVNLEWTTRIENITHARKMGLYPKREAVNKRAVVISKGLKVIRFDSCQSAADYIGVPSCKITLACQKHIKTIKGYTCDYAS